MTYRAVELLRLTKRGDCWCEKGLGNPMYYDHSPACKTIRTFLESTMTPSKDNLQESQKIALQVVQVYDKDHPEDVAHLVEDYALAFRMDELDGVMCSIDKWFNEGDPRLKYNPATRAGCAREIALQAIESLESDMGFARASIESWRAKAQAQHELAMKTKELLTRQYEELRTWNAERSTPERWHDMLLRHKEEQKVLGE